jgi:hypothetical protein
MPVKILVSGEANSGKTTLTKTLDDVLVVYHDGKQFSIKNTPHVNVPSFETTDELISVVSEKVQTYHDKFGKYPETIVFDSVSRIFDTLYDACNRKYSGFQIYSMLDKEIKAFNEFIEQSLIPTVNVVIISHAIFDQDANKYNLVGKGSFQKTGGFLSTVDESVFIETKANKRIVHFKSTKFPARTLTDELPESTPVEEFSLKQHIEMLAADQHSVSEFEL